MNVLVYEQQHTGHFYRYLRYLLPPLASLGVEVVVAVTESGRRSPEFDAYLADIVNVAYEATLSYADPRDLPSERLRVYRELRPVVRRVKRDHVLVPSGDSVGWFMMAAPAIFIW